jgi:hypothetical protein
MALSRGDEPNTGLGLASLTPAAARPVGPAPRLARTG